jgi:hypothetical protein
MFTLLNPWKTDIKLIYNKGFSSYRTVNTLQLGYKNQSDGAVSRNNRFYSENRTNYVNTRCGQNAESFSLLNPVAIRITTEF